MKFSLNQMSDRNLKKVTKKLKRKKSLGTDGLTKQQLIIGADILVSPLTSIINQSIKQGSFPEVWKEALVTPVLKKGDASDVSNYRPLSCLPVSSKVLVCVTRCQTILNETTYCQKICYLVIICHLH